MQLFSKELTVLLLYSIKTVVSPFHHSLYGHTFSGLVLKAIQPRVRLQYIMGCTSECFLFQRTHFCRLKRISLQLVRSAQGLWDRQLGNPLMFGS